MYHFIMFYVLPFLLDGIAVWAGTKAVIAVEKRKPLTSANWGALANACVGTVLFIFVFGDTLPAFFCGMAGAYVADIFAIKDTQRREARDEIQRNRS